MPQWPRSLRQGVAHVPPCTRGFITDQSRCGPCLHRMLLSQKTKAQERQAWVTRVIYGLPVKRSRSRVKLEECLPSLRQSAAIKRKTAPIVRELSQPNGREAGSDREGGRADPITCQHPTHGDRLCSLV